MWEDVFDVAQADPAWQRPTEGFEVHTYMCIARRVVERICYGRVCVGVADGKDD
jgi:hypothetical protein